MKGQLPNENGQCFCQKEQKWTKEGNFYTYKDNSKTKMCKQCLTMHIDNFNPDTFLWLLEDLDVPYVPEEWNVLRDRAFAKDPQKMNGMSVFGKYLSKMKLRQWKEYGWADTERLQALNEEKSRANIAQMVNVLQAMILTKGSEIVLTPTYHVFRMYNVHQDATSIPVAFQCDSLASTSGRLYPILSVSASKSDAIHVSLSNPSVTEPKTVELEFDAMKPSKVSGEILVGKGKGIEAVKSHNDFGGKNVVAPTAFKDFKTSGRTVKVTLPPASVVVLEVK